MDVISIYRYRREENIVMISILIFANIAIPNEEGIFNFSTTKQNPAIRGTNYFIFCKESAELRVPGARRQSEKFANLTQQREVCDARNCSTCENFNKIKCSARSGDHIGTNRQQSAQLDGWTGQLVRSDHQFAMLVWTSSNPDSNNDCEY